jgi:hypothetical protein
MRFQPLLPSLSSRDAPMQIGPRKRLFAVPKQSFYRRSAAEAGACSPRCQPRSPCSPHCVAAARGSAPPAAATGFDSFPRLIGAGLEGCMTSTQPKMKERREKMT